MAKFLVKIASYIHITGRVIVSLTFFCEILMVYVINSETNKTTASY